jgi:hypothetical protein
MWSLTDASRATGLSVEQIERAVITLRVRLIRDFNKIRGAKCIQNLGDWRRIKQYVIAHDFLGVGIRERLDRVADDAVSAVMAGNRANRLSFIKRVCDNCGNTAENSRLALLFYLEDRDIGEAFITKDVDLAAAMAEIAGPTPEHVLWDISFPVHSFLLERCTGGKNLISQSYQSAYNLQYWLELPGATCYRDSQLAAYERMRDEWRSPSDAQLTALAGSIRAMPAADLADRQARWRDMPFDPFDPWNQSGDMVMTIHKYVIAPPFHAPILKTAVQGYFID